MNHKKVSSLYLEYASGLLDEPSRRAVEQHVQGCEMCQTEYAQSDALLLQLDRLKNKSQAAPPSVAVRVMERIGERAATTLSRPSSNLPLSQYRLPLAVVATVVVGVIMLVMVRTSADRMLLTPSQRFYSETGAPVEYATGFTAAGGAGTGVGGNAVQAMSRPLHRVFLSLLTLFFAGISTISAIVYAATGSKRCFRISLWSFALTLSGFVARWMLESFLSPF